MAGEPKSWDVNLALTIYVSLVLVIIGITWLALNKVEGGQIFLTLFVASIGILVLSFLFTSSTDNEFIRNFIKNPFEVSLDLSIGLFMLGWMIPLLIKGIGLVISSPNFSLTTIQVPLATTTVSQSITQQFSAAQLTSVPFWNLFTTVFTAGVIEELVFGFISMVALFLIGLFILKMVDPGQKGFLFKNRKTVLTIFAIIGSMILFSGAHQLNQSYASTSLFFVAAMFRGILNTALYFGPLTLSFNIGLHQSNNFVYFFEANGWSAVLSAMLSIQGLIIAVLFALMIYYAIRRLPNIWKELTKLF